MTDIKRIQLIENYHKGDLSSEEEKLFTEMQAQEPDFQEELDDYGLLLDGFDMLQVEELENNMAAWEGQHTQQTTTPQTTAKVVNMDKQPSTTPIRSFRRYYSIAAAVVLLLMLPLGYTLLSGNNNFDEALAYNSVPHIIRGTDDSTQEKQSKARQNGLISFAEKDYTKSASLLEEYCSHTMDHEASFFLGISHLRLKQYDQAIKHLDIAITISTSGVYSEEAFWHIAVANYQLGKKAEAKRYLEEIMAAPEHSQKDRAKVLLKKL